MSNDHGHICTATTEGLKIMHAFGNEVQLNAAPEVQQPFETSRKKKKISIASPITACTHTVVFVHLVVPMKN